MLKHYNIMVNFCDYLIARLGVGYLVKKVDGFFDNMYMRGALALALVWAIVVFLPDLAYATSNRTQIENTLCSVIQQLGGPIGRGVAVVAVVVLGFSLFLGKISWGLAIALAVGIGAVFGAQQIVNLLGGTTGQC